MILNMVGGGGSVLNFEVVPGTSKPTSPKENTIWANSEYTMGSWDISPSEPHRVSRSTNMIVYPFLYSVRTVNGVTFTVDDSTGNKGKVTVNGTNTSSGNIVFRLSNEGIENREMLLQPGTYYLSGNCESSSSTTHRLLLVYTYDDWAHTTTISELENNGEFTIDKVAKARVSIQVSGGKTVTNAIYQPMLTKGSKGTSYEMGNATGQIWVKTAPIGTVLMDAVKGKNSINVQISAVYEYTTNGGWKKKNAQVYQYGTWNDLWDGYYYKAGNQYTDITGGWTGDGWTVDTWHQADTVQMNTDHIYFECGENYTCMVGTAQKVDLTGIKTLKADVEIVNMGQVVMYICASNKYNNKVAETEYSAKGSHEYSLDVSGYSGEYYIMFYMYGSGAKGTNPKAKIMNVWGE